MKAKTSSAKALSILLGCTLSLTLNLGFSASKALAAPIDMSEMGDLAGEQAKEKLELEDMGKELKSIKGEVNGALGGMNELSNMLNERSAAPPKEIHLFAKEAPVDIGGGTKIQTMTYNGNLPGPQIDVIEGQPLRVILHNQLKVPTSLHFHGMIVPQDVDGLPRARRAPATASGAVPFASLPERLVKPKDSYGFQLIAPVAGTYYYHPQIVHLEQRQKGLYGAIIVHPRTPRSTAQVNIDQVLFLGELPGTAESGARPIYLINGKTAPYIPALEVRAGARVRLRFVNVCEEAIPLHLSGHKMEVVGENGSDLLEPRTFRDTLTINPGERIDVEFTAGNVGVWSLASEKVSQTTSGGKFPGGIAMVLRYIEMKPEAREAAPEN